MQKKITELSKIAANPLILGTLTVSSYLISYQYQAGYLSFFGVPSYFISLELSNIIESLLITAATLLVTFNILQRIDSISSPIINKSMLLYELLWVGFTIFFGFRLVDTLMNRERSIRNLILLALFVLIPILITILYKKSMRFNSLVKFLLKPNKDSFLLNYLGITQATVLAYIFLIYVVIDAFFQVGYFKASTQIKFETAQLDGQDFIVIAHNNNRILLKPLDKDGKTVWDQSYVYSVDALTYGRGYLSNTKIKEINIVKN